ncbi:chromate transporter [Anaerocolumna sedimenticola]|uniref:Chromate transporter n=1 Tax=Anaerocolumna sedimenticola TaxID=2696063 RepID=A0A6P1TPK9_9FIRM|nr:chromate transporter [Anaerocolumna sedimenticola]QHQ61328.1 chromate transporter [Anaerocolumna sedimenticola]
MDKKWFIYRKLFFSTFTLSAFTFGGGYVIVPLMRKKFVEELKWLEEKEMLDLTAIAQSSPGPIAVNASILMGYRMAGLPGVLTTVLGTVLPPFIILSIISSFYIAFRDNLYINAILKGMQAGIAAVITDVILSMGSSILKEKEIISVIVMFAAFFAAYFFNINVIYIILTCGAIGALSVLYHRKIKKNKQKNGV